MHYPQIVAACECQFGHVAEFARILAEHVAISKSGDFGCDE
jgi:hypothetical protein